MEIEIYDASSVSAPAAGSSETLEISLEDLETPVASSASTVADSSPRHFVLTTMDELTVQEGLLLIIACTCLVWIFCKIFDL